MPLVNIHVIRGRSDEQVRDLLDAIHAAVADAMGVPDSDRYQILTQHAPNEVIALDTGLGYERTSDLVIIQVTSKARSVEAKTQFYSAVAQRLEACCGIARSDLVVTIVENSDEDWSFGGGKAQFLTGAL